MFWEVVEQVSDAPPSCFMCSLDCFAHEMFELGEDLLDGVQVGAIRRQEQEARADASDGAADGRPFVAGEIIHDHWTCNGFVPVTDLIMPPLLRTPVG